MELQKIIAYAVSREIEAAEFYRQMQNKVHTDASKILLKDLEIMEREHIKALTEFSKRDVIHYSSMDIPDLKISNFMEMPNESDNMTFQEVLVLAMKREEISNKLYAILASEAEDNRMRNLFLRLADEEAKHKFQLETIYDDEILKEN